MRSLASVAGTTSAWRVCAGIGVATAMPSLLRRCRSPRGASTVISRATQRRTAPRWQLELGNVFGARRRRSARLAGVVSQKYAVTVQTTSGTAGVAKRRHPYMVIPPARRCPVICATGAGIQRLTPLAKIAVWQSAVGARSVVVAADARTRTPHAMTYPLRNIWTCTRAMCRRRCQRIRGRRNPRQWTRIRGTQQQGLSTG